ncbi:hypothetical protein ACQ4PT_016288 [Festuca glaucescens]
MVPILPTPPRSKMLPLLPTPSVVAALLALSAMPGRADFVQRWDTTKKYNNPCSIISLSPCMSSSSESGGSSSRADSIDRWDANKKYEIPGSATSTSSSSSSDSGGSHGRADSVDRWDSKKLKTPNRTSPTTDRGRLQDGINKRPASRASSAERWDLHKKHRPEEKGNLRQTEETTTAAAHKDMARMQQPAFAGPNFDASPDPIMLPMPSFFLRAH